MVNFTIGDYVLRSRVDEKGQNKLLITWVGLYAVTATQQFNVFWARYLVTGEELDVDASRLKFFADKDLKVTEELLEHVAAQGIILRVRELLQHRWNNQSWAYEILVGWHGLEVFEDSWEPLVRLYKDFYLRVLPASVLLSV
uniref:Chromo domain-containing protein n=1 Tax=Phytophthora ramorum TaxID=164328 RepID=H3GKC6_PHYRM